MAIWQNTFFICPMNENNEVQINSIEDIESIWCKYQYDINLFNIFEQFLKTKKSWSDSILLFGSEDSTCIEVYFDELIVNYIRIRIDFRLDNDLILEKIIEFCKNNKLMIISEDMTKPEMDIIYIKNFINSSKQVKKYNDLSTKKNLI